VASLVEPWDGELKKLKKRKIVSRLTAKETCGIQRDFGYAGKVEREEG
jgi:hypothetical protein